MADNGSNGIAGGLQGLGSQIGIINTLRTGNVIFDLIICMLIPLAFSLCGDIWNRLFPYIQSQFLKFFYRNNDIIKTLDYEFRTNLWGSTLNNGKEERNNILQKAITLYIGELKNIEMRQSKLSFMAIQEKGVRDDDGYYGAVKYGSTVDQLKA